MESSSKATTSSTTPLNVAGYTFMRNYQNGSDRMSREGQILSFYSKIGVLFLPFRECTCVYCIVHSDI